jgi:hypothetical protein
MLRYLVSVIAHLIGGTIVATATIVLSLALLWFASPWCSWLLRTAGVSWEVRQRFAPGVLQPQVFLIAPAAIGLAAYLAVLACRSRLHQRRAGPPPA